MRTSGKSLRSKRAGSCHRRKGPTASRWELQSSHSHQNKNTRHAGVFILVECGIEFESRNHLIAGSTMSCCVSQRAAAHNIRMPRSPTPPAWARESATPTRKYRYTYNRHFWELEICLVNATIDI